MELIAAVIMLMALRRSCTMICRPPLRPSIANELTPLLLK
jgi:hypothetical protein